MTGIWGSSYFFTAIALRAFDPPTLLAARMSLGALTLWGIVAVLRPPLPRERRVWMHLAVLGAFGIAVPFQLITWGQTRVPSSVTAVLSATTPIFLVLILAVLTRGATLTAARAGGVVVAFTGVVLMSGAGAFVGGGDPIWTALILASSVFFAAGNAYTGRFLRGVSPLVVATGQITMGALILGTVMAIRGPRLVGEVSPAAVAAVLEIGILGSAVAYLLFFRFIIRWSSTAASFNTYLQPLVGVALGVIVLHESLTGLQWIAMLTILCGLALFTQSAWLRPSSALLRSRVSARP